MKGLPQQPQPHTSPGRGDYAYPLGGIGPSCVTLVGILVCLLCFVGCSEPTGSELHTGSVMDDSELEFQKQSNRPPTAKTLIAMADILAKQGKDPECELVLQRAIQDYPKFLPAYDKLAEVQMRRGRTDAAIGTIRNALRIHSGEPVLLNNLGMCRIVRRDYEKALEMFTKAAGIVPENAKYRANMAVALGLVGRDEESLSLLKQVLPDRQADHNLSVLREARYSVGPVPEAPFETPSMQ